MPEAGDIGKALTRPRELTAHMTSRNIRLPTYLYTRLQKEAYGQEMSTTALMERILTCALESQDFLDSMPDVWDRFVRKSMFNNEQEARGIKAGLDVAAGLRLTKAEQADRANRIATLRGKAYLLRNRERWEEAAAADREADIMEGKIAATE